MRFWLSLGFVLAALAVVLGAFAAHGLKHSLSPERFLVWETAVRYQMYSALGIQFASLQPGWSGHGPALLAAGACVFSGSLYLLCLLDQRWLGAITPIGGLLMIAGWLLLAKNAWKKAS